MALGYCLGSTICNLALELSSFYTVLDALQALIKLSIGGIIVLEAKAMNPILTADYNDRVALQKKYRAIMVCLLSILQACMMLQGKLETCFWIPMLLLSLACMMLQNLSVVSLVFCGGLLLRAFIVHSLEIYREGFASRLGVEDVRNLVGAIDSLGVCLFFYSRIERNTQILSSTCQPFDPSNY